MSAPTRPRSGRKSRRRAIWIGIAAIAPTILILGTLAAVPLLARRSQPDDPATVYAVGDLRARANLAIEPTGDFTLTLKFAGPSNNPVTPSQLTVLVSMEMGGMQPLEPAVLEQSVGTYVATGRLPMQGRWRFLVSTEQGGFEVAGYAGASF